MLTLIKIRGNYLARYPCAVFFTYFLIPVVLILILVLIVSLGIYSNEIKDGEIKGRSSLEKDLDLFNKYEKYSIFNNEISYAFVTDDPTTDCSILYDLTSINFACVTDENDEEAMDKNIVKIQKKDGKYDIQITLPESSYLFGDSIKGNEPYMDPFDYHVQKLESDYNSYSYSYYNNDVKYFFELQSLLAKFLIKKEKGENNPTKKILYDIGVNKYPPNTGHYSYTLGAISSFSIVICLQFSMTTYFFTMRMIDEKEKKLNILLERQGITRKNYFFSWMLAYLVLAILPFFAFFFAYLVFISLHAYLFFINLFLLVVSLFSFTYFLYSCISTSKTASILIKFIYFTSAILGWPIPFPECSKLTKVITSFIPQVNFYLFSNSLDKLQTFANLSWEKIWLKGNKFSLMESLIMYLVEICLYSFLSVFILSYKNSGLNFFQYIKSIFTKVSRKIENDPNLINENIGNNAINLPFERHFQELSPFNQQRKAQNDCLKITNVCKKFDTLKAVDNFNVELFGNEIFCLLGHNGAGKTTLVNMISGIYDPNKGDIFYKGKSIITDKDYLFTNIGVCQQEDIFFEYLTVSEHLKYMCEIKGGKANPKEITELIVKIGLAEKSMSQARNLSGGQKRKLCTALALIGNSKIILLDEPTSGLDPISKKSLWDFLKSYQKDKIILLTTHSLDEAEYLGDRIGIMSDGQLICCGTSSYLKSKYPCGFNINLLIDSKKFDEEKKNSFFEKIKEYEPQAQIKIASKFVFSINIQSNNENIDKIFEFIEQSKYDFGIEDFTVASTSLEDVFLKINNTAEPYNMKYSNQAKNNKEIVIPENLVAINDCFSQLVAQLQRNILPIKRNFFVFILEFLSGLGIIYIFVFLFSDLIIGLTNSQLNLKTLLKENNIFIYEPNSIKDYLKKSYLYESTSSITLKELSKEPNNLYDLMDLAYDKAWANIAFSCISVLNFEGNVKFYIGQTNVGYLFANTMFTLSAFLKNEYGIEATILSKLERKKEMSIGDEKKINEDTLGVLIIICIGSVFGFIMFLGGLIHEKIRERRTNIKHLLYLSGSNSWSYWISFFIIDYVKLLIFTLLLIIPIYYVSPTGSYYFLLNMVVIDLSSLVFIYFVSFFGSNADSGVKFLFTLLLLIVFGLILFIISTLFLLIVSIYLIQFIWDSFTDSYNFTVLDITPITSMLLSFGRILYGIVNFEGDPLHKYGPGTYLITSYIVQFINFIFYSILLILMEAGYLRSFLNYLKIKWCLSENNFVFSKEEMSQEFLIYNDVRNPLILNQLDNNTQNQSPNNNNINNNNINQPLQSNINTNNTNNIINTSSNKASISGNNNINSNNVNSPLYGNNVDMNAPIFGNNVDMNAPIFGNNADFMNIPIYGNNLDNLNIPVNDNSNIINTNSNSLEDNNKLVINNANMSQPLLEDVINTNNNNNINNTNNIKLDRIDYAMNDLALPETNKTYNVRKGNPYINEEKDKLNSRSDLTTRIEGLQKTFCFCCSKNVRAIDNLYLGLEANEKFGLLGFNGSGKTTTFRAITNEILYDFGKITLFGFDNRKEFERIRNRVGYCPQENPLFEFMKVREILDFYSNLKTCNIPYELICEKFALTKYLDTYCINLSGGNKRKLTFAIAIMNNPTLLLLDEPSTGVDPDSRRIMWKNINELSNSGHKYNLILTTHSMEEAEIMCDRVSWLKKGNFVCIGNPEKLKIKYSLGYKLHVKFNDEIIRANANNNNLENNMEETLKTINSLVVGFTNYSVFLSSNPAIEPYIKALIEVINKINPYTNKIILIEIGKDLSFKLILNIKQEHKSIVFSEILSMKNTHKEISEMIISMESLENILTSFR